MKNINYNLRIKSLLFTRTYVLIFLFILFMITSLRYTSASFNFTPEEDIDNKPNLISVTDKLQRIDIDLILNKDGSLTEVIEVRKLVEQIYSNR